MRTWLMDCIIGSLKAYVTTKIIVCVFILQKKKNYKNNNKKIIWYLKISHQHLLLFSNQASMLAF